MWRTLEYDFGGTNTVLAKLADGTVVIEILADVEFGDRTAVLRGLHVMGAGLQHGWTAEAA